MSDKLDNDLKNRIRDVFDNYEDDTADAGWELLRQRFPAGEKKQRVVGWWWYSAAAVLLLCLGTWFFYPQTNQQVVVHQPNKTSHVAIDSASLLAAKGAAAKDETAKNYDNQIASVNALQQNAATLQSHNAGRSAIKVRASEGNMAEFSVMKTKPKGNAPALNDNTANQLNANYLTTANDQTMVSATTQSAGTGSVNAQETSLSKPGQNQQLSANSKSRQAVGSTVDSSIVINTKNTQSQQVASVINQAPANQQKGDAILRMIAADDARRQALAKNAVKKSDVKSSKAMLLSVYAATYFNYAKGSESQVNVGAGFTSDFKLSSNFKLSTGLAIAQNKLNYNSDNNVPSQINDKALANSTASNSNLVSASFAYDGAASVTAASPMVKNYNASLIGLDIPLNIKYQFNPEKTDTYISAGISSGTYINETYRSTLSYGNYYRSTGLLAGVESTSQTQETTTNQHFSTFDFAKTLNLSFGIGYPVGKSNRLIVEPFLKYPLNGLGSQDIRFGASGINLKLSFSGSKK